MTETRCKVRTTLQVLLAVLLVTLSFVASSAPAEASAGAGGLRDIGDIGFGTLRLDVAQRGPAVDAMRPRNTGMSDTDDFGGRLFDPRLFG
jgi:hypothetical protein